MDAHVKLKDIATPVYVENVSLIKVLNSRTGKETVITDFKEFRFYASYSYSFIGKSIFNTWGQNIEYVLFA